QPPPRPPQSTIPQLTSLLINNAGALHTGVAAGNRTALQGCYEAWQADHYSGLQVRGAELDWFRTDQSTDEGEQVTADVRTLYRPCPPGRCPGARRGPDAEPQLHRHRAHSAGANP
ncbi:hypothetical protein OSI29_24220, partial [Mycobacterium ulcerans]|nr:hypothetical protein [Mycobacterium ulcerans]MEB4249594.1 hypothetical protein [Mycobacterium ulcerans]MEB4355371.1 hypothetical protein [Mycobacterium ulcerans]